MMTKYFWDVLYNTRSPHMKPCTSHRQEPPVPLPALPTFGSPSHMTFCSSTSSQHWGHWASWRRNTWWSFLWETLTSLDHFSSSTFCATKAVNLKSDPLLQSYPLGLNFLHWEPWAALPHCLELCSGAEGQGQNKRCSMHLIVTGRLVAEVS